MMAADKTVLVIMGSVRAGRVCPVVSDWVMQHGRSFTPFRYELIDLAQWSLPMNDEPAIPATGHYTQSHTRAWSAKILSADAIMFVTPQYNWGYPAALKNAIDHLYGEWGDKPAIIVSYGGHGGTQCAEQLKQIAGAVKLRVVSTMPALVLPVAVIREGAALDPDKEFAGQIDTLRGAFKELSDLLG